MEFLIVISRENYEILLKGCFSVEKICFMALLYLCLFVFFSPWSYIYMMTCYV